MSLFLVRHAKAGKRRDWDGDDMLRPLDKIGYLQAEAIALRLAGKSPTDLFASRYVRCVQTLEPLAQRLGQSVTINDHLTEGADFRATIDWMTTLAEGTVMCSHGDVIPEVIAALERRGLDIAGDPDWRKATVWVLERESDEFVAGKVWSPPAVRKS
jgi:8-oxo-dGTP diphosphatase